MSADAFAAFEEAMGTVDANGETIAAEVSAPGDGSSDEVAQEAVEAAVVALGCRFRDTVLSMGGGKHPVEVFRAYRGRDPSVTHLLRHSALLMQPSSMASTAHVK